MVGIVFSIDRETESNTPPKRNKAGLVVWNLEFMTMMLMSGRREEDNEAFDVAIRLARELEQEMDSKEG